MNVPTKLEAHESFDKTWRIKAHYPPAKISPIAKDLDKEEALEIVRRYNAFEGLLNACKTSEDLLDACKTSLGAFDALKTIGAHLHLPGYDHCLKIINAAIEKAKEK